MDPVKHEVITNYWDGRAQSYSNGVVGELGDSRRDRWTRVVEEYVISIEEVAHVQGRTPRVLDLGCGPGFFTVLFAERGWKIDAIDASSEMLEKARGNLSAHVPEAKATFLQGDVASLPFPDDTFDLAISRNVTWLMREPEATYAEWLRVLRPGGRMLAFDANWYHYLADPKVRAQRAADQTGNTLEGWDTEAQATSKQEKHCEEMAATLPTTWLMRPEWDRYVLGRLGATDVFIDADIWKRVWSDNEKSYYASSPMFLIEAVK